MGIISWFINQQTSLGGPILYVHKLLFPSTRQEMHWDCNDENCYDTLTGPRGRDSFWLPEGASCSTPRRGWVIFPEAFSEGPNGKIHENPGAERR